MMKRRTKRKNFGTGYGFTFHGAFTDKKDAEAKEAKTPGSFIKGTPTKTGYRWIVQKPRTNPRKAKRVVMVGDKKFSRWETAQKYAKKQAANFNDRIAVIVRESDGTQLTHYVDPPVRSNPPETKFDRVAKRNQGKAAKLYQRMTALLGAGKFDRADKIQKQLARLAARMGWSMGYVASFARASNPAELLVMGNPAELLVMNPGDDPWVIKAAAELYPGKTVAQLTADRDELSRVLQLAAELKREARARGESASGENSMAWGRGQSNPRVIRTGRQNATLGEYENGNFYPLTRRPRSRRRAAVRRRASNPAAADLREAFTGRPAEWVTIQDEPHMPAGDYAKLGQLLALYVKPRAGGQVLEIKFGGDPAVVADETGRQIYFVGGDQDVSDSLSSFGADDAGNGVFSLGEARRIDYKQRKEHVPDPEIDEWRHEFGEESGVRPEVLFDSRRRRLLLEGGEYTIRPEGIVN